MKNYYSEVIATDLDDPATDDNGLVTYSLGSGQEHFQIDPQTGLVTAKVTLGRGVWRADVIAEDGGGLTGAATLVVKVGEVVEEAVEEVVVVEEQEAVKGERRRRFLVEQQTRLDTLDAYCSSKQHWPGLNSNVIYVLQVLNVMLVLIQVIIMVDHVQERRLVWCPVYKAASTNWMYNLLFLAGRQVSF